MTTTDKYVVFTCPHCGAESCEREIGSYNTFGGVWWSDCFLYAPMAPSPYIVTRCWKCQKAFCRYSAKTKVVSGKEVEADGKRLHMVAWTGAYAVLKEVLDAGKLAAKAERDVLMQLVWAGNHKGRIAGAASDRARDVCSCLKAAEIPQAEMRDYMLRVSSMTNLPLWLRAEIRREMGEFAQATAMLKQFEKESPGEYGRCKELVDMIEKKIEEKDCKVFER